MVKMHSIGEELITWGLSGERPLGDLLHWLRLERLEFGFELSAKLQFGSINAARALVSLPQPNSSNEQHYYLKSLIDIINPPKGVIRRLETLASDRCTLHYGVECISGAKIHKIYVEQNERKASLDLHPIAFVGIKWSTALKESPAATIYRVVAEEPSHQAARTWCHLAHQLLQHAAASIDSMNKLDFSTWLQALADAVCLAADSIPSDSLILKVCENSSGRDSYDINLYDADLTLETLSILLFQLSEILHLPQDAFLKWFRYFLTYPLGHLAFGLDTHSRPFFTIYYGGRTVIFE